MAITSPTGETTTNVNEDADPAGLKERNWVPVLVSQTRTVASYSSLLPKFGWLKAMMASPAGKEIGNPGSGKSHLLMALAQELVVVRERKMHFTKCTLLMQDLLAAKRDLRLSREIKRLGRYDGLIIDDLGYLQQSRDDMEVVFTLLAERYERGSVLMTSNLPFSKWEAIFKDALMTAAAIDRFVHHSVIIELNIPSYRVEHAKKNQQAESQAEGE